MVAGLFEFCKVWIEVCNSYWEDHGTNLIDATVNFWLGR